MVDTGETLQKLHLYLEDAKESYELGMVHEQSKRKTKIDFDFQAINDLKTKQTANKAGMRSSADKSCRNLGGRRAC